MDVIAGLEVLRTIKGSGIRLRHRIMLIDFANEEGSRRTPSLMGSGMSAGIYDRDFIYNRDQRGVSFGEALERSGLKVIRLIILSTGRLDTISSSMSSRGLSSMLRGSR